jgi:hypothetical protein
MPSTTIAPETELIDSSLMLSLSSVGTSTCSLFTTLIFRTIPRST